MASPSNSTVNANVPFLRLPGEIFNDICRLAVANQPKVALGSKASAPGLVHACSKTYHAASRIFWEENVFYLRDGANSSTAIRKIEQRAGASATKINKVQIMAMFRTRPLSGLDRVRGYLTLTFTMEKTGALGIERHIRGLPLNVDMCCCKFDTLSFIHNEASPTRGLFRCLQDHAELLTVLESCWTREMPETCGDCGKTRLARIPS